MGLEGTQITLANEGAQDHQVTSSRATGERLSGTAADEGACFPVGAQEPRPAASGVLLSTPCWAREGRGSQEGARTHQQERRARWARPGQDAGAWSTLGLAQHQCQVPGKSAGSVGSARGPELFPMWTPGAGTGIRPGDWARVGWGHSWCRVPWGLAGFVLGHQDLRPVTYGTGRSAGFSCKLC